MGRWLLTGGGGFVGGAILRRLLDEGEEVVALTSAPRAAGGGGAEWRTLDLLSAGEEEAARLVAETGITHCIHAAWYTNHADYLMAEVNRDWLEASVRFADGFASGGGTRFVGLGTCLEYDQRGDRGRFSEGATPLRPETLYAKCKVELFKRLEGRSGFAWVRPFYVYGPSDRGGRLIPHILSSLARGERVGPRFGGLRRDYIHVDDLAEQIVTVGGSRLEGAVNSGTGAAEKVSDIFRIAGELFGRPDLVDVNAHVDPGQAARIEADMSRFRAEVGEPARRPLRQGLAELVGAAKAAD